MLAASKKSIYDTVLQRYNTLMAEQRFQNSDASIISLAAVPVEPVFPKIALFLVVAASSSAFLGLAGAFSLEMFRPSFGNHTALAEALRIRALAAVPLPQEMNRSGARRYGASLFGERIRDLRNALSKIGQHRPEIGQVFLLSSSVGSEGKSLIASGLARSFANLGGPVLLLDADLRKPTASSFVKSSKIMFGLGDVLTGKASLDEAVIPTPFKNLFLLPAVRESDPPLDQLTTEPMANLLQHLRQRFDVVIIDTPPIAAVSDAVALSLLADATVVIARFPSTQIVLDPKNYRPATRTRRRNSRSRYDWTGRK